MFRPEATNSITIWPRYADAVTGNQINVRCVLDNCVWSEESISITNRTGNVIGFTTSVMVPYLAKYSGRKYISPTLWNSMPYEKVKDDYWTINPNIRPLVSNGEVFDEFTWAPLSGANSIAVQETALRTRNPNIRQVITVNASLMGIPPDKDEDWVRENLPNTYRMLSYMWHITFSA